jgi:hypothetical protein
MQEQPRLTTSKGVESSTAPRKYDNRRYCPIHEGSSSSLIERELTDREADEEISSLKCPVLQGVKGFYDHPGV